MNQDYDALHERVRRTELLWNQLAHERVKERLGNLFFVGSLVNALRSSQNEAYDAYSEQVSRLQYSTSRIPPRELEDAVFSLEDRYVQKAFDIYCDESPERKITDVPLLWVVYNLGLVPFIEGRVLRDTCLKLDKAQPSLGLNTLRPEGERFFCYQSQGLKRDFPVVIRIVDRLKAQWSDKIFALAQQLCVAKTPAGGLTLDERHPPEEPPSASGDSSRPQAIEKPGSALPNAANTSDGGIDPTPTSNITDIEIKSEAPLPPTASIQPESELQTAVESGLRRGRPREDALAEKVAELRGSGRSWGAIKIQLDKETGVQRTIGAYRSLYASRRKAGGGIEGC